MLPSNISILFYLKKPKNYKEGAVPIYMRITIDGKPRELSIGRNAHPNRWNRVAGKMIGTKQDSRELNEYLDLQRAQVLEMQRDALVKRQPLSSQIVKEKLTGRNQEIKPGIIALFKQHNDELKMLIGKDYAMSTIVRYSTALDHVRQFILWKYKTDDISISKLDYEFISQFEFWLKSIRNCNHNSAIKYISNFRKVVNRCVKYGLLTQDPFVWFKMNKQEVIPEFLTEAELNLMKQKSFSSSRLTAVRDTFLFCCYTGLAFTDVQQLSKNNLRLGIDGNEWIFFDRQKTSVPCRVPLLPQAKALLEKYAQHECFVYNSRLLPIPSNQKYNAYLKEIADVCGIQKRLTSHAARHTFATTVTLGNGVPMETVSKLLGHKNLRTTQHYAKILDEKVAADMRQLGDLM
jgi:site-specific recombinase XerD